MTSIYFPNARAISLGAAVLLLVGCASGARQAAHDQTPLRSVPTTPIALMDSLGVRLASLEIDRARARVIYTPASSVLRDLDTRIASTLEVLVASTSSTRTARSVLQSVLEQLDDRQAVLADTHRQLLITHTPQNPMIAAVVAEEAQLAKRRAELRASLGVVPTVGLRE